MENVPSYEGPMTIQTGMIGGHRASTWFSDEDFQVNGDVYSFKGKESRPEAE
jgi:hypothetical protein